MTQSTGVYFTHRPGPTLYAAVALSGAVALVHLLAMPGHLEEWWGYGAFFLVSAVAQGAYGVALLRRRSWRSLLPVGVVGNLAILTLYVATRTVGIPLFGPLAGEVEGVGPLDVSAAMLELTLVAALVTLSRDRGLSREGWSMLLLGLGLTLAFLASLASPGSH